MADLVKEYNRKTVVTVCKINLDDPMNLLISSFLDESKVLPVTHQQHP